MHLLTSASNMTRFILLPLFSLLALAVSTSGHGGATADTALRVFPPATSSHTSAAVTSYPFQNSSLSLDVRMANLISLLTVDEKVSRLHDGSMFVPGVPRLSIPTFEWGQECLRGARNNINEGNFSAFPQSIGLGATWNVSVFDTMGRVVSDEMRGQRNSYHIKGESNGKTYLHCWAPVANVLKDPRWGRAAESYGESTLLIYSYTSHYLAALHQDHPQQIKIAPTVKHYTVYDGPEEGRFGFNAVVSARDLHDTFTSIWRKLMQEQPSHIRGVMASYSALNGVPVACDFDLLTKQPRFDWGWKLAAIVGDCGAVEGVSGAHGYASDDVHGAALSLIAGVDMDCGDGFDNLRAALDQSIINEADIDVALRHSMEIQFKLGFYDTWGQGPYDSIPPSVVDSEEHRKAVVDVAQQSMVLLQNNRSVLPLVPSALKSIAVIGPSAYDLVEYQNCITNGACLLSHAYFALTYNLIHPLDGIRDWLQVNGYGKVQVKYVRGCERTGTNNSGFAEAVSAAKGSDVVIYVGGLDYTIGGQHSYSTSNRINLLLSALDVRLTVCSFCRILKSSKGRIATRWSCPLYSNCSYKRSPRPPSRLSLSCYTRAPSVMTSWCPLPQPYLLPAIPRRQLVQPSPTFSLARTIPVVDCRTPPTPTSLSFPI